MDVLVLSTSHRTHGRGMRARGSVESGAELGHPLASPEAAARRRWAAAARRRWAALLRLVLQGDPGPEPGHGAVASHRNPLIAYTGASIVLGLGLLAVSTALIDLQPAIDPGLPGTTLAGPTGGLLLWLMFGLLGSMRALRTPDGGHMTFHMPFIGAAMILGGPTAGAWVAFLSTIERRELESQPWYGILANHAVLAIAAVIGGLVTSGVAGALGGGETDWSSPWGASTIIAAGAGVVVLAVIATAMGAITVLLRDGLTRHAFLEAVVGMLGRLTALEIGLALLLALAYVQVGWWTPIVVGGFVILIWDNHPMPAPDRLTGILTAEGFNRRLETGLGRMRRGMTPGATLLALSLELVRAVNDRYGYAVGDEVLGEIGVRLRGQARGANGIAGRGGGATFYLFLPGVADQEAARDRADQVYEALGRPIATSVGPISTSVGPTSAGVSIGALVLQSWGGVPSAAAVCRQADQAMYYAARSGGGVRVHVAEEPAPSDDGRVDERA
jgi:diguanylate cyclase (GGDEF)-like protein